MNKFIVYTINGLEISLEEYRERNERVLRGYSEGRFKTSEELKDKFKSK